MKNKDSVNSANGNRNTTFNGTSIGRNSNVHSLKEKLLREIAQEGNVSLLKLTKDVIKGKYDDFSTLSTMSEFAVVVQVHCVVTYTIFSCLQCRWVALFQHFVCSDSFVLIWLCKSGISQPTDQFTDK